MPTAVDFAHVAGAAGCVLTLFTLYMLIARPAGLGSRLPSHLIPRPSRRLPTPTPTRTAFSTSRLSNSTLAFTSRAGSPTTIMLSGAVKQYERQRDQQQQRASQSSIATSQGTASQKHASQSTNPGYRNPLKPATDSTINGLKSYQMNSNRGPIKRTASGLAKTFGGSFEDGRGSQNQPIVLGGQSPSKSGIPQVTQTDLFDADEFDSDIELDIEEPVQQKTISYPKLPPQPAASKPVAKTTAQSTVSYPDLSKAAETSTFQHRQASTAADSGYGTARAPASQQAPDSSAPLPWSSSPVTHLSPKKPFASLQHFAFGSHASSNAQAESSAQPKPAKRRTIPWLDKNTDDELSGPRPSSVSTSKSTAASTARDMATPYAKDKRQKKDKDLYPWNTTASAVKEQQKKHREEAKKIRNVEGTEDSVSKAKSTQKRPARVFLSDEQQHVLELVIEKKKSVFFTGSAGTGKSVLMREIISSLRKKYSREPDRVAVTASTGLAACNVGGVTLHSFAGIGLGKEEVPELVKKIKRNQKAKHRWMRTKVLVVDEVSMVDGELFDKLESIARQIRNNARPFGGIQLVITGDFFQLPPVPENNRVAKFAFDAATWSTSVEHTIGLHHVFRQKDPSKFKD